MSEGRHPVYCTQCGSIVGAENRFCGVCGARVGSDAPAAVPTEQIPAQVRPPLGAPAHAGGTLAVLVGVGVLAFLALIVGAVFAVGFLSGDPEAPGRAATPPAPATAGQAPPQTTPEEATRPNPAPADSPESLAVGDSAEVRGVKATLNGVRTLPATDFDQPLSGADNQFVAVDMTFENTSGEPVSVSSLLELVLKEEDGYSASQTIHSEQRQLSEGNIAPGQRTSGEVVYEAPPDTEALQLDYTPFAGLETFTWSIGDLGGIPAATGASEQGSAPEEQPVAPTGSVDSFVSSYYAAVGSQDWQATYSLLDSESQAAFTEEAWIQTQSARNAAASPSPLSSAVVNSASGQPPDQSVNVTLYYDDGAQETLDIVVRSEGGAYKRHLTADEIAFLQNL